MNDLICDRMVESLKLLIMNCIDVQNEMKKSGFAVGLADKTVHVYMPRRSAKTTANARIGTGTGFSCVHFLFPNHAMANSFSKDFGVPKSRCHSVQSSVGLIGLDPDMLICDNSSDYSQEDMAKLEDVVRHFHNMKVLLLIG